MKKTQERKKRKRKKYEGRHICPRNMGKLMMVGKMRKKIRKNKKLFQIKLNKFIHEFLQVFR